MDEQESHYWDQYSFPDMPIIDNNALIFPSTNTSRFAASNNLKNDNNSSTNLKSTADHAKNWDSSNTATDAYWNSYEQYIQPILNSSGSSSKQSSSRDQELKASTSRFASLNISTSTLSTPNADKENTEYNQTIPKSDSLQNTDYGQGINPIALRVRLNFLKQCIEQEERLLRSN